jgi:type III restriction enzyme
MKEIILKEFQKKCILDLLDATSTNKSNEILIKSPTGSGKTIIMVNFIDQYLENIDDKAIFIWFTPGIGDLEEQSKSKMEQYIPNRNTKTIKEVLQNGFDAGDTCFINWEVVTKKGNNAISKTEKNNLFERIDEAKLEGLKFIIIVDEQHYNKTIKTDDLKAKFDPEFLIGISATVKEKEDSLLIEINEEDVISEGLITKMVAINEDVKDENTVENPTNYLIDLALKKQAEIHKAYLDENLNINPLILIQIPNNQEELYVDIQKYLETLGITVKSGELAIWLSKKNENTSDISEYNSKSSVLIMKQAIATGWDCPRAKILVKLRENMNDIFTIQTIGRIRRSINGIHYKNDILNTSYLYTYDSDFVNGVNSIFEDSTVRKKIIYLKDKYYDFKLTKECKKELVGTRINKEDIEVIYYYLKEKYNLSDNIDKNKINLQANEYNLSTDVLFKTKRGQTVSADNISKLDDITLKINVKEKSMEKELNLAIYEIGAKSGIIDKTRLKAVLKKIFSKKMFNKFSLLKLNRLEFVSFIINNKQLLKYDIYEAIKSEARQLELNEKNIKKTDFKFPVQKIIKILPEKEYVKKYKKDIKILEKNVYELYPSNEKLSLPEKLLIDYAEESNNIKWIYKNGESSEEFFSIIYTDANRYNTFYPDFILQDKNEDIWIIETKGGENEDGSSRNVDELPTPLKYEALKRYCNKNNLKYGFVREEHIMGEKPLLKILFSEKYIEDMNNENWVNLNNVL